MAPPNGVRAKATLVLSTTFIALVMFLLAGEVAVRYLERHRQSVPGIMPFLFYRHNRLEHALVHNMDYFGWASVNAQGFRGGRPTRLSADSAFRIMTVGGSTTFDSDVTGDDKAWPARLEHYLNATPGSTPVEVINAGVPGYHALDNLIRLQTELYRYHPDVILLYDGHNDLLGALQSQRLHTVADSGDRPGEIMPESTIRHWLARHSLLYAKLAGRVKAIQFRAPASAHGNNSAAKLTTEQWTLALEQGAEQFGHDITSFVVLAQSLGIKVILVENVHVTHPDSVVERDQLVAGEWLRTVPFAPPDVVFRGYQRYNETIRQVALKQAIATLPTTTFGLHGVAQFYPTDPIHFSDAGADSMARRTAEWLERSGVLAAQKAGVAPSGR